MPQVLYESEQVCSSQWTLVGLMVGVQGEAAQVVDPKHHPRMGFVSDLDDTAFITAFRTAKLFERFCRSSELLADLPRDDMIREVWELARRRLMPYNVKLFLEGKVSAPVVAAWFEYWQARFFTNRAIRFDMPERDVRNLLPLMRRKVPVGYLTGRHHPTQTPKKFPGGMVEGTLLNLWQYDFPHGPVTFKPDFETPDTQFKREYFATCLEDGVAGLVPIGYLDNEPGIVNAHDAEMERQGIPHLSIWIKTVHAPLAEDLRLRPGVLVLQLAA